MSEWKKSIQGTYIKSKKLSLRSWILLVSLKQVKKLFKNLGQFNFQPIFVQEVTFKDKKTRTWIEKHVLLSVSIHSNLVGELIFLYHSGPHHLVASFIGALEGVPLQSKAWMELSFLDIETKVRIKLNSVVEKLTLRHNWRDQARRIKMT